MARPPGEYATRANWSVAGVLIQHLRSPRCARINHVGEVRMRAVTGLVNEQTDTVSIYFAAARIDFGLERLDVLFLIPWRQALGARLALVAPQISIGGGDPVSRKRQWSVTVSNAATNAIMIGDMRCRSCCDH